MVNWIRKKWDSLLWGRKEAERKNLDREKVEGAKYLG